MFSKVFALCAVVAVSQAGLLPAVLHYSPAETVSSQSIIRHDQPQGIAAKVLATPIAKFGYAAPVTKLAVAAPIHYSAANAVSSQNIIRHDQPSTKNVATAPVYQAAPASITYHAAPIAKVVAPAAKVLVAHQQEEYYAYPKYEYTYSVADGHTGDQKSQQESRDGDVVKGSYSFHEADGSIRTVEYTADDHNGFNAVVHNTAPTAAPAIIKAAPVVLKAPALQYYHH